MARRLRHKTRRKSARRARGLGAVPGGPSKEGTFAARAAEKARAMHDAIGGSAPNCALGFSRLVDTVSYYGMAEGAAADGGSKYANRAVTALESFRRACRLGGGA